MKRVGIGLQKKARDRGTMSDERVPRLIIPSVVTNAKKYGRQVSQPNPQAKGVAAWKTRGLNKASKNKESAMANGATSLSYSDY